MIDFDALLNAPILEIFGASNQFIPRTGSSFAITGDFWESFLVSDPNGMPGMATSSPAFCTRLANFSAPPKQKDQIEIAPTATYKGGLHVVKEVQPDSQGWLVLLLNYVGP